MNDFDLLREYVDRGSENAFAALVDRYVNLVYSAALRQTAGGLDAEEVTQAVFIILARKAHQLSSGTVLCGWLVRTTRFVALNARRREMHRIRMEKEAMNASTPDTESAWQSIAPVLDEALLRLSETDRAAVVLRFFEKKSFKEIGAAIGASDDVAQKRVSRALDKLRADFAKRGLSFPASLVGAAMVVKSVQAAPANVAPSILPLLSNSSVSPSALAARTIESWAVARNKALLQSAAAAVLIIGLLLVTVLNRRGATSSVGAAPSSNRTLAAMPATNLQPAGQAPSMGRPMNFRVLDEKTQSPIPDCRLTLTWEAGLPNRLTNVVTTDKHGAASVSFEPVSVLDWDYRIEVFHDGYVPKYISWSEAQGDTVQQIPAQYTTKLSPATAIGAIVVNEQAAPISGARIVFNVYKGTVTVERERLTYAAHYHVEVTDGTGK